MQTAKAKQPCIVFIDEIDSIGSSRKIFEQHSKKTLNQILTEMDGFEENSGVIVMAATNLPEVLDPALTRPGRFDRKVTVNLPDIQGRTVRAAASGVPFTAQHRPSVIETSQRQRQSLLIGTLLALCSQRSRIACCQAGLWRSAQTAACAHAQWLRNHRHQLGFAMT